ncbi:GntR family transcriptional regulator [Sulfitobacter sp. D35]|uniref:FadR/GntR family transcriptional regulator n=1 Tax=Sulfitobacter sp. D35 TaxID=3083252 RepID=UPI00296EA484|nr:GntR family transcriptional regulator [Sulfitobacter sp. D35]MDW4496397.1 GntR family transcriptional regulator [Sulfitobacter sp. D35]
MTATPARPEDLSARIAAALRDAIVQGRLIVDQRLPSEAELSEQFGVSRPTVREALKRLAAQSLIRTQRGASGGAFVNRLSFQEAQAQQITTSTLLLSMNAISFETACEARFALERACAPLSAQRRQAPHLEAMQTEIARQSDPALSDEAFCASDVAFHRALVDGAGNPVLSYQLAGAVEAMQPLMNMITFTARSRERIVALHRDIADAVASKDGPGAGDGLLALEAETLRLGRDVFAERERNKR